ncbi:unnamed protein product [Trichogramma brassicae]|uniref:Uncharacterized protein n=1 Tax=Trichogramma brassicae TaxID=86971 RepID=A0A6H5IR48_9HYME|nr:unnamed protein product [Trichogramma brassicae]
MREEVNWENEDKWREFLCQLEDLISDWKGQLADLREIFQPYDIDWLLAETVKKFDNKSCCWSCNSNLVEFVIDTGYRDEPDVDEDGKPLLRRVTAVHHAARKQLYDWVWCWRFTYLFKVYDRFDVNYTDDSGLTHFHFACMSDCDDVAKEFLELGQDSNLVWQETGDSPLHLALKHRQGNIVGLLLRSGADLSLTRTEILFCNWPRSTGTRRWLNCCREEARPEFGQQGWRDSSALGPEASAQ